MKVHDLRDKQGRVFAFEIGNLFMSRRRICKIVREIPKVRITRTPHEFPKQDEFCEFEIDGQTFLVWEPWGDSSRYWIGPKTKEWCPQVEAIRAFFLSRRRFL